MLMQTIFLDESGYTGENLLDREQRVFALASLHVEEGRAAQLKNEFFGQLNREELKYSQMRRRPSQQRLIASFVSAMASNHRAFVKIYVVDKRYALAAKIVDILVEKVVHARGANMYEMRPELLATSLYTLVPAVCGEDFFQELLAKFAAFVRTPTQTTCDAFFEIIRRPQSNATVASLFKLIATAQALFGSRLADRDELGNLDMAMPAAFALANWWQIELQESLLFIHDRTSNLARYRELWDALVDPELAEAVVGVGSRVTVFPVAVEQTRLEASEEWAGLQLADVLAGAAAAATNVMIYGGTTEQFENELVEPMLELITQAIVRVPPGYQHPQGTLTPQASDLPAHMATILARRRE